jgi:hypothetical protein
VRLLTKKKISSQLEILRHLCESPDDDNIGDRIVEILESEGQCGEVDVMSGTARDSVFYALGYVEAACHALDMTYPDLVDEYL